MIADRSQRKHPFKDGKADHAWFQGFKRQHPSLILHSPQPLSYCQALCSNQETTDNFLGKIRVLYRCFNLISKPMLIFNVDKTGVSIVHKTGKVVAELARTP